MSKRSAFDGTRWFGQHRGTSAPAIALEKHYGAAGSQPVRFLRSATVGWVALLLRERSETLVAGSDRPIGRDYSFATRVRKRLVGRRAARALRRVCHEGRRRRRVWPLKVVVWSETIGTAASPWEWSTLAVSRAARNSASRDPMQRAELRVFVFEGMPLARNGCMTALSALYRSSSAEASVK
jgi:hypothetical protein